MVVRPARSTRSLRSLARPCATRSPRRCYALHSLRSLATLARSPLCYALPRAVLRSPLAPLARYARSLALVLRAEFGPCALPTRFARGPRKARGEPRAPEPPPEQSERGAGRGRTPRVAPPHEARSTATRRA